MVGAGVFVLTGTVAKGMFFFHMELAPVQDN